MRGALSLLTLTMLLLLFLGKYIPFPSSCLRTAVSLVAVAFISCLAFIIHLEKKVKFRDVDLNEKVDKNVCQRQEA